MDSAIRETVLHDVPPSAKRKTVPKSAIDRCSRSTLLVRRTLQLASLRAPDLMRLGVGRETLIGSLPTRYGRTALWAKAIHDRSDDVDDVGGMVWISNLCDPDAALLLFGDRVVPADLLVAGVRAGSEGSFLDDVRRAGQRSDIWITL